MKNLPFSILRIFFLLFFSLLITFPVLAQLETGFHYGRLLKINPVFPPVPQNAWVATLGIKLSEIDPSAVRGPGLWLHFQTYQLGNPQVLGYAFSLMPSLELRLIERNSGRLIFRQGASIAYMSRPFDRRQNPLNNIIGAPISMAAQSRLAWEQKLSPGLSMAIGGSFSHFSNGNTRVPNLGVNIPGAFLQLQFQDIPTLLAATDPDPAGSDSSTSSGLGLRLGLGAHAFKVPDGPVYQVFSFSVYWQKRIRRIGWFQAGTEVFYDEGSAAFARNQEAGQIHWRATGIAIYGGLEYRVGKVGIILQTGPYLKTPFPHNWKVYTRLGMTYHWRSWYLGGYVHAHGGEADYLDLSLGINL